MHSSGRIAMVVNIMIILSTSIQVPYELLNKKFRTVQKVLDREISHVNSSLSELTSCTNKQSLTQHEITTVLDGVTQRLTSLKRKVTGKSGDYHMTQVIYFQAEEGLDEEIECSRLCKTRLDHLKAYASCEQSDGVLNAWKKVRCDRMLVDHFLRSGHYSTALALAKTCNIEVSEYQWMDGLMSD